MGPLARWLDASCSWSQRNLADRQAAGLAFGYVAEDTVGPLNSLRPEIVVGGRIVAYQAVNEARRGNFLCFVGWAVVGKRFTVGHGRVRMLAVFSVVFVVRQRPAVDGGSWCRRWSATAVYRSRRRCLARAAADALPFAARVPQFPHREPCEAFFRCNGTFPCRSKNGAAMRIFNLLTWGLSWVQMITETLEPRRGRFQVTSAGGTCSIPRSPGRPAGTDGLGRRGNGIGCVVCPKLRARLASWLLAVMALGA